MNNIQQDPLAKLYDIEGLDEIGWWPLAPVWWTLLGILTVILIVLIFIYRRKYRFNNSWRYDALKQLSVMEKSLSGSNYRVGVELSEFVRRIAVHQYSRHECAGLEGQAWLDWLTKHDPGGFDWRNEAAWLVEVPYAPTDTSVPEEKIRGAIQAVKGWVR